MVASACQWFGVAIETASTPLSANVSRMSSNSFAFSPVFFTSVACATSRAAWFTSHNAATLAPGNFEYTFRWFVPRPPIPTMATFTRSFAPQTREAAAALAAPIKNLRVVSFDIKN